MISETIAKLDHLARPVLTRLAPEIATQIYSSGRNVFLSAFFAEQPPPVRLSDALTCQLWNMDFRSGLMNAAGLFKNGEGYELSYRQGAGAYLAGTTTAHKRSGNTRNGVAKPFTPYPHSNAASNWLGLPNDGHAAVAKRLADVPHHAGFPIGASVMAAPESTGEAALEELVEGMQFYDYAGVHFLEMNESCPNIAHTKAYANDVAQGEAGFEAMTERLEYISTNFLKKRLRHLPVVVKFSTDTAPDDIPRLMDILLTLGFDGVNIGNTSIDYAKQRTMIAECDHAIYDYFTETFGGGVSGKPLRASSLNLVRLAKQHLERSTPRNEFHILRTGGVNSLADVQESRAAGASMCQWYTGLFERFAQDGHLLYKHLFAA
jgi:dihydroorotate dehydrogenase